MSLAMSSTGSPTIGSSNGGEFFATPSARVASVARIGCPGRVLSDAPVDKTQPGAPIHCAPPPFARRPQASPRRSQASLGSRGR